jgi:GTPase involved in cell partitioning and DNA repair
VTILFLFFRGNVLGESLYGLKEKLPYSQIVAESGGDATQRNCCLGKNGVDKWIPVPVGVNVYDNLGNYLGMVLNLGVIFSCIEILCLQQL